MPVDASISGQAYALTVFTPIVPGSESELRTYLEGLRAHGSPLARLPRTHFGRWVVVEDFTSEREQPKEDHLPCPYLLFTSNFDGDLDSYLDELCERLAPEAKEIWGRCIGCPESAAGAELKAYLLHNRIPTGVFFAAYPNATVSKVKESLLLRERMIAFAIRAQGLEPAELLPAFTAEFAT
jgi:hypothetical protein